MNDPNEQAFLEEIAAVFNKHGLVIGSCGCCSGTVVRPLAEEGYGGELGEPVTARTVEGR